MFHHFSIVKRSQPRLVHFFFLLMSTFFGISYVNNSRMTVWIWMFADLLEHKVVMPTWFDHFSVQCHHEDGDRSRSSLIILWHLFIVGFEIKAEKNEFFFLFIRFLLFLPLLCDIDDKQICKPFFMLFLRYYFIFLRSADINIFFDFSLQYSKNSEENRQRLARGRGVKTMWVFSSYQLKTDWKKLEDFQLRRRLFLESRFFFSRSCSFFAHFPALFSIISLSLHSLENVIFLTEFKPQNG